MTTLEVPTVPTFRSFSDAYSVVLEHPDNPSGLGFRIAEPWDRLANSDHVALNFARALWFLWGRNDPRRLSRYGSLTEQIWPDNRRTRFAFGRALDSLRHGARTAVVMVPGPARAIALHFARRDDHLDCISYLNACGIVRDLPGDVFTCTFAHEFAASHLGLGLGYYTHHVASPRADHLVPPRTFRPPKMLPMPPGTTWTTLETVRAYEPADVDATGLHPYWRQIIDLFNACRLEADVPQ